LTNLIMINLPKRLSKSPPYPETNRWFATIRAFVHLTDVRLDRC
jgi:hypothetical protein